MFIKCHVNERKDDSTLEQDLPRSQRDRLQQYGGRINCRQNRSLGSFRGRSSFQGKSYVVSP